MQIDSTMRLVKVFRLIGMPLSLQQSFTTMYLCNISLNLICKYWQDEMELLKRFDVMGIDFFCSEY